MTTINALKKLYVELGGNIKDVENITIIPEMIDALSEIAGSTIELPGVTSEDNGDILTVVEGKWAKAEAPEELPAVTTADYGDALIVDSEGKWAKSAIPSQLPEVTSTDAGDVLTVDSEGKWAKGASESKLIYISVNNNNTLPSGMTKETLLDYYNAGKFVILVKNSTEVFTPAFIQTDGQKVLKFTSVYYFNDNVLFRQLEFYNNESGIANYTEKTLTTT